MLLWGLIVAVALIIGSLPLFVGLAVVLPVLGHSTWHLYRKVVEPRRCRPGRTDGDALSTAYSLRAASSERALRRAGQVSTPGG